MFPGVVCARRAVTLTLALVAALGLPSCAFAIDPGTAIGTLRVDDTTVALAASAALDYADRAELAVLAGDHPALRIALAAVAFPSQALDGPGHQRLRAELAPVAAPIVLLRVARTAHGRVHGGQCLLLGAGPMPLATLDLVGLTLARGDRRVLGAVDFTSGDGRVHLLARFSAPLFNDQAPATELHGEAARASPQADVLLAFEQALRQGAFAHARKLATPARQRLLEGLEDRNEGEISALVARYLPPAARRQGLRRLVVTPPMAWLVGDDARAPLVALREIDGRWRVAAP